MKKRLLLLTGEPGVGKTTVLIRTVEALKSQGYAVGGMISREVRTHGERVGFEISDLSTNNVGWLAHVSQRNGPKVGRYRVNLQDLECTGVAAIVNAVKISDVVIIDEIGPMELFSQKFREAVTDAVQSNKFVIAVVHWKARECLIDEVKMREDAELLVVTLQNRENLHMILSERTIRFLKEPEAK
jgi:nucleoside-triphosphatase